MRFSQAAVIAALSIACASSCPIQSPEPPSTPASDVSSAMKRGLEVSSLTEPVGVPHTAVPRAAISEQSRFILGTLPHEPHARYQQFKQGATHLRADSSLNGESKAFYDRLPLPSSDRFGRHDAEPSQKIDNAEPSRDHDMFDHEDAEDGARRQLKGGSGGRGGSRGRSYAYVGGRAQNHSSAHARADVRDSVIGRYLFRPVRAAAEGVRSRLPYRG